MLVETEESVSVGTQTPKWHRHGHGQQYLELTEQWKVVLGGNKFVLIPSIF